MKDSLSLKRTHTPPHTHTHTHTHTQLLIELLTFLFFNKSSYLHFFALFCHFFFLSLFSFASSSISFFLFLLSVSRPKVINLGYPNIKSVMTADVDYFEIRYREFKTEYCIEFKFDIGSLICIESK